MSDNTVASTSPTPLTLLGLGAMGAALARTWLAAGHPLTVWNRSPGRTAELAAAGARVAATAAEAVAASRLVVTCLLDDASVREALAEADLTGRDLVDLTTSTPAESRTRAAWANERGARFLDGGIMAVPPMIGVPEAGGYVFYSGSREVFDAHRETLAVPAATRYVGADPGFAALHDVALLSAMTAMFAGPGTRPRWWRTQGSTRRSSAPWSRTGSRRWLRRRRCTRADPRPRTRPARPWRRRGTRRCSVRRRSRASARRCWSRRRAR
ncbi:NAD binding domain of 6-phosphogluconate dehydrogenase [Streptomyces sp. Termitarium-T10T-6]|nr:NAD binding domain of 6-phosphogluconate dehydrogenase [Streptomyces sp. Termitarium-T10T-6]